MSNIIYIFIWVIPSSLSIISNIFLKKKIKRDGYKIIENTSSSLDNPLSLFPILGWITCIDNFGSLFNNSWYKYTLNILLENKDFKQKINELLVNDEVDIKEENPVFEKGDLFYSIHEATLDLKGTKTENGNWNLTIVIKDKYDFTDFKTIDEYETKSIKDIFGSTLNNFGAISSEYKVIKPYAFEIKIKKNNYKIK